MNTPRALFLAALVTTAVVASAAGCSVKTYDPCVGVACSANPTEPARAMRADGRVDVDAITAWPTRGVEPTLLTAQEIAQACALVGACTTASDGRAAPSDEEAIASTARCAYPDGAEERAVPTDGTNERWSFWVREVLARAPSCEAIHAIHTNRAKQTYCEEDGCWWTGASRPSVACAGTMATLVADGRTWTRDCAHAYARCDEGSATGCTDRRPLACDPRAMDRCDGDVKLGCDSSGIVSFHDCTLIHTRCQETAVGAECVPIAAGSCEQRCDGSRLSMCVFGGTVTVDCADFGAGCTRGHCALPATAK